ncbi:MAG: tetratricopeptide repeat protein [Candidatus Marinimicrobia bacterium]|nr:tetratricopeptide repeat protein [Candidatus Neomarinimicrobiota bacterium]MBT6413092.1 tetratricopeptide repeat protein [Candidatus Neomarinimicrobiota bacterium]
MIRILLFLMVTSIILCQDRGQKAFNEGKFDEARSYYEKVLKNRKKDEGAQFGLGATAYQQQDMETAARSLNAAMNSKDKSIASKAMYNLGNMFKEQEKMDESLALFRKAIELDPTDEDAKINYELLRHVIQKREQQQEQSSDQDDDSDKDQDSDQQTKDDKSDQNQDGDKKQKQDEDSEKDQDKEKEDQEKSQSEQEKQKQDQEQSEAKKEDSPEKKSDSQMQAEAILNALKDQEQINQKRQISKANSRKLEKDW